jgi:hypothetical protein
MPINPYLDSLRVHPIRRVHNQREDNKMCWENRNNKKGDELKFWDVLEEVLKKQQKKIFKLKK